MSRIINIIFFSFLFGTPLTGQEYNFGTSEVRLFAPKEYEAGAQNWAIAQGTVTGILYVGNTEGMMTYDGEEWQLYPIGNQMAVRSIYIDEEAGRIYVGGQGEFGYFSSDEKDELVYHSLSAQLSATDSSFADVWRILPPTERVPYLQFVTYGAIFNIDTLGVAVPTLYPQDSTLFEFGFTCRDKKFVYEQRRGLLELEENGLREAPGDPAYLKLNPAFILPYPGGQMLIGTQTSEICLYLYDGRQVQPFPFPEQMQGAKLYTAVAINDSLFAIGSRQRGIFIMNTFGEVVQHIDRATSLVNDNILSLYLDNGSNLWAGLGYGLAFINYDSPLKKVYLASKRQTQGYDVHLYDGRMYLATENGLFYKSLDSLRVRPGPILFQHYKDSHGEAWQLGEEEGQLLIGRHEGTYTARVGKHQQLSQKIGGWVYKRLEAPHADKLIGGTYLGINLYGLDPRTGRWEELRSIKRFEESARLMAVDGQEVWVSHIYKGVYRIKLDDQLQLDTVLHYGRSTGFPTNELINLFQVNGTILFGTERGVYQFDSFRDTMISHPLNELLGEERHVSRIFEDQDKSLWCIADGEVIILKRSGEQYVRDTAPKHLRKLGQINIPNFENLNFINARQVMIGTREGFSLYDRNYQYARSYPFRVLIRSVSLEGTGAVLSKGHPYDVQRGFVNSQVGQTPSLAYHENDLRFQFAAPYYEDADRLSYRSILHHHDQDTSGWSDENHRVYTNLSAGDYTFEVWAKNIFGEVSEVGVYHFRIRGTFWDQLAALSPLLIFITMAALGFGAYQRVSKKRQERERERERLAFAARESQRKIKQAQQDLELSALFAAHSFDTPGLLERLRTEMSSLQRKGLFREELQHLTDLLTTHLEELRTQEKQFSILNLAWIRRLHEQFPHLTDHDLEYCLYASYPHLTVEEIAKRMGNISTASVHNAWSTIKRQKLKLDKKVSIRRFLEDFRLGAGNQ